MNFRISEDIVLEINNLDGALVSTRPGQPPNFDDPQSFSVAIDNAEVRLSTSSLTNVMNRYVFTEGRTSLKDLKISIADGHLVQKGKLHKLVDVPFTSVAEVSVTPEGQIRLHPVKMKAAGVPAGGLMKLFGLELDELVKLNGAPGVRIVDNDFLLDPSELLPSPRITGRVTAVRVDADGLIQVFGHPAATAAKAETSSPRSTASAGSAGKTNYMHYRGGTLQFGKLTMRDADLEIIDADPRDRFDFFLARYNQQLVAGYSVVSASGGLTVYMPDYARSAGAHLRPK